MGQWEIPLQRCRRKALAANRPADGGIKKGWKGISRRRVRQRLAFLLPASVCLLVSAIVESPVAAASPSVYISEFLVNNARGLKDEEGARSPWIELYNGGSSIVHLRGWFLTDSTNDLIKWRMPNVALLPDRYLVVFASGKNRTNDLIHLHTNFRLEAGTAWLALVDRATNIASEFTVTNHDADVSFGHLRDDATVSGAFAGPTPGKPNATSGAGFAPEVSFATAGGSFTAPFALELSSRGTGAVIRYTLDGSLPSGHSPEYHAPLLLTNSVQVRARAFLPGLLPGPPKSEAYLFVDGSALSFTSTLPILVMDTFGSERFTRHGSAVHLSFIEPVNGKASLTNAPAFSTRAAFHIRGSTSSGMPQSGYAVHLVDEFNEDKAQAVLGLPADSDWVLYAPNVFDPVLIHNPFIHQLSRDIGRYSPRTRFLEAFVVRHSGPVRDVHYQGLYVLEERIKIGRQRVNVDRLRVEDIAPPRVTGSYLLKFDRLGSGENGFSAGGPNMVYVDPREDVINLPQWKAQREFVEQYFRDFERALYATNWLDPQRGYRAFVDVNALADFHIIEVLSGSVDAGVFSTYFYKPRNGRITFEPHWDFDRALGSTDGRDDNPRYWNTGPFFRSEWWRRIFSDVDAWQQWVDRWQELRRTHLSLASLFTLADTLASQIRDAQPRQYAKWGFQPRGGSYQSELQWMKDWLSNRVDFIDRQLAPPPVLSERAGAASRVVTLAAETNAVIYYTIDGSDPRLPGGGTAAGARPYAGPIELKPGIQLVARTRDPGREQMDGPPVSTPWSAPVRR